MSDIKTIKEINLVIKTFLIIIFIGFAIKILLEYKIYYNAEYYIPYISTKKKYFDPIKKNTIIRKIFIKKNTYPSILGFICLLIIFCILVFGKVYNELDSLNKKLITIGFPIILGFYLINTILFTYCPKYKKNGKKEEKKFLERCYGGLTKLFYKEVPKIFYLINPLNLSLIISILYSVYWNDLDYSSWVKWIFCIISIIGFNILLGVIYYTFVHKMKGSSKNNFLKKFNLFN